MLLKCCLFIVCTHTPPPPPFRPFCWEVEPEGGGGGVTGKEGVTFFSGEGLQLLQKNKLKSEIFNDKKVHKQEIFFSAITKYSNWGILTKNLVTFKRYADTLYFVCFSLCLRLRLFMSYLCDLFFRYHFHFHYN